MLKTYELEVMDSWSLGILVVLCKAHIRMLTLQKYEHAYLAVAVDWLGITAIIV